MMTNRFNIKPFDIFFAQKPSDFGDKRKHYYVCVYSQALDPKNKLWNDVYGLIITTNKKYESIPENDYNVSIYVNGKKAFVCCDKLIRMKIDDNVEIKKKKLSKIERQRIRNNLNKFLREMAKQIKEKEVA
jgi:hypothetical protein